MKSRNRKKTKKNEYGRIDEVRYDTLRGCWALPPRTADSDWSACARVVTGTHQGLMGRQRLHMLPQQPVEYEDRTFRATGGDDGSRHRIASTRQVAALHRLLSASSVLCQGTYHHNTHSVCVARGTMVRVRDRRRHHHPPRTGSQRTSVSHVCALTVLGKIRRMSLGSFPFRRTCQWPHYHLWSKA